MAVLKSIELVASSSKSWEDAAKQAVGQASKTLYNLRSLHIKDQTAIIEHGDIATYQVTVQLWFEIEDNKEKDKHLKKGK